MSKEEIIKKITQKKEFSQLPRKDVERAFNKFDREIYSDEEKVKLTRKLLREVFSGFSSGKILSLKDKTPEWILKKHLSTRERLAYYKEIYKRILKGFSGEISIIDLGAGVNGFSYNYFNRDVNYIVVEAIGQFVDLMNYYFKKEKINGKAIHLSLFEIDKIKKLIEKQKKPRVVFLFKVIDSLEKLEKDYTKKLLKEIMPFTERCVISFATESWVKRKKFHAQRKWLFDFIRDNFKIADDFELKGERYLVFENEKRN